MTPHTPNTPRSHALHRPWLPGAVLLLGLLNGLLYVFLVPPWQHYDEPGHLEYVWLLAHQPGWLNPAAPNPQIRRQILASMQQHNFFRDMPQTWSLLETPANIGIRQLDDPPLYYLLAALPLRLFRFSEVIFQLYLARLVSLALYLFTLWAAWGALGEILPHRDHPLRALVPISMALLPAFTDLMTAVNNDVGAVTVFTAFVWGVAALFRRGLSWRTILFSGVPALLALVTKSTVYLALPLWLLAIAWQLWGRAKTWSIPVSLLAPVCILLGMAITPGGGAAYWYPQQPQGVLHLQATFAGADVGTRSLKILPAQPVAQPLLSNVADAVRGQTLTFGGWFWAEAPAVLQVSIGAAIAQVNVTTTPTFARVTLALTDEKPRFLRLAAQKSPVFVDGLLLLPGDVGSLAVPAAQDANWQQARWDGRLWGNLLRNASFEQAVPQARPFWVERFARVFPAGLSVVLTAWQDPAAHWYFTAALRLCVRTFWAVFGWGHVTLSAAWLYPLLGWLMAIGALGALWGAWRYRTDARWLLWAWLALAAALIWVQTLLRGVNSVVDAVFLPGARYLFPVVLPTVLWVLAGWRVLWRNLVGRWLPGWVGAVLWLAALLGLNLLGLYTLVVFWRG